LADDTNAFLRVIQRLIDQFTLFVEEQSGWALPWNDDHGEKPEDVAQLLFRGFTRKFHDDSILIVATIR
jgi:hypothetical protein